MALLCTNTSLPPFSGVMNPNPLPSLKNFTVPRAISLLYFFFAQRALAAFWADSARCSAVSFLAVAFPPLRPRATAAGFFFGVIPRLYSRHINASVTLYHAQRYAKKY